MQRGAVVVHVLIQVKQVIVTGVLRARRLTQTVSHWFGFTLRARHGNVYRQRLVCLFPYGRYVRIVKADDRAKEAAQRMDGNDGAHSVGRGTLVGDLKPSVCVAGAILQCHTLCEVIFIVRSISRM